MDTIKCGRTTYDLCDGETIMDNGSCLQLITRTVFEGFNQYHPRVSKKAFAKFKTNKHVRINNNHQYGSGVTLWSYLPSHKSV